jgi:hypothetical protein
MTWEPGRERVQSLIDAVATQVHLAATTILDREMLTPW